MAEVLRVHPSEEGDGWINVPILMIVEAVRNLFYRGPKKFVLRGSSVIFPNITARDGAFHFREGSEGATRITCKYIDIDRALDGVSGDIRFVCGEYDYCADHAEN